MEGTGDFLLKLEAALERRAAHLESQRLPLLKEAFHALQVNFESIMNLLIKKGLVREDPYHYAQKITEIPLPEDGAILESQKTEELSFRLSGYRSKLDHMATYYQFSVPFLDLHHLKQISMLLGYISWKAFSDASHSPTTKALAQYLAKIRLGSDQMAAALVKDSLTQLEKNAAVVGSVVSELVSYQREAFKAELRQSVLPGLDLSAASSEQRRADVKRTVKSAFAKAFPGRPYYPELVDEILEEDYGAEGEARKKSVFEQLVVPELPRQEVKVREEVPNREILLETVRIFSRVGPEVSAALDTLVENQMVLLNRPMGLGERVRRWLRERMGRREREQVYEIEYFEGADTKPRTEKVGFDSFIVAARKKASLFAGLITKGGAGYGRLEAASEDQLLEFVSKQIADLIILHRRMSGLNTYFLSEVHRDQRSRMKGIKLNLTAINNGIVKANVRKHDYVARMEEKEQMRRLGIK